MEDQQNFNEKIAAAILNLDAPAASSATLAAVAAGVDVMRIIEEGIATGMTLVGERYQTDEYHLPELLYAEEVMRHALEAIHMAAKDTDTVGVTVEAEERLIELSRSWVGQLSSCVTRLFRYDDERKKRST